MWPGQPHPVLAAGALGAIVSPWGFCLLSPAWLTVNTEPPAGSSEHTGHGSSLSVSGWAEEAMGGGVRTRKCPDSSFLAGGLVKAG